MKKSEKYSGRKLRTYKNLIKIFIHNVIDIGILGRLWLDKWCHSGPASDIWRPNVFPQPRRQSDRSGKEGDKQRAESRSQKNDFHRARYHSRGKHGCPRSSNSQSAPQQRSNFDVVTAFQWSIFGDYSFDGFFPATFSFLTSSRFMF